MASVVIDTDVVSYLFKRDSRARAFRRYLLGKRHLLSFMTIAEIDRWALEHQWGKPNLDRLARFLRRFIVPSMDRATCGLWAKATDDARGSGRPISCADAWIAATALQLNAPLVTNNPTDHAGVSGLTVLSSASP
jgi:predicted nucleic acid-binding protein